MLKKIRVTYQHVEYGEGWSSTEDITAYSWEDAVKIALQNKFEYEEIVSMQLLEEGTEL